MGQWPVNDCKIIMMPSGRSSPTCSREIGPRGKGAYVRTATVSIRWTGGRSCEDQVLGSVAGRCTALDMAVGMNIRLMFRQEQVMAMRWCLPLGLTSPHFVKRRNCLVICCPCRQGSSTQIPEKGVVRMNIYSDAIHKFIVGTSLLHLSLDASTYAGLILRTIEDYNFMQTNSVSCSTKRRADHSEGTY